MSFIYDSESKKSRIELKELKPFGILARGELKTKFGEEVLFVCESAPEKYRYLNIIKIVNSYCYKLSDKSEDLIEVNPTLELNNSEHSFWSVNETEHKIDVMPVEKFDFRVFSRLFEEQEGTEFSSGEMACTKSFERYLKLRNSQKSSYLVVLGKKNWPKKPAIKYKLDCEGDILTRSVRILELSRENFINSVEHIMGSEYEHVEIRRYPSFYKRKDRVICIDQEKGFVYGLSYSEAKTLRKESDRFNQIEVEFWSGIRSEVSGKNIDWYEVDLSHKSLVSRIESKLEESNFYYKSPGGRKYEWLSAIEKNGRKIKIDDII